MKTKWMVMCFLLTTGMAMAIANTPPTPVIVSCAMREGTTLMDITYRVNDPDDARVSAWPLAFVDGTRSFAKVIRPATFTEGTANNFGTNVLANTDHHLVWNVGADWNIDLGQLKFEIICKDARGLLPFDWVSIPATATTEALTISKNAPSTTQILDAFFLLYASFYSGLSLQNGTCQGTAGSAEFSAVGLVAGATVNEYAAPFLFKAMNLTPANLSDAALANSARAGSFSANNWAVNKPYLGGSVMLEWGQLGLKHYYSWNTDIVAIDGGGAGWLGLRSDGILVGSGITFPGDNSKFKAFSVGQNHNLVVTSDGTVVAWGSLGPSDGGQCNVPAGLSGVTAVAAGGRHSLALKADGTVIGWGTNNVGQITIPAGLSNVTAIAAGDSHSLALKSDGTVVGWGHNSYGQITIPVGLSNVTKIVSTYYHNLALKSDGTLVGWGQNSLGQITIPVGLCNVTEIATSLRHSLVLKNDGTVLTWGSNSQGECTIPTGVTNVVAIAADIYRSRVVIKVCAP